ncbi:hypothetical protein MPH_03658 [Macrophomina phaseolina MS6]|uniref:Uncharacterized protein n=1 Tax=Macrophomina phaseolina (strain MS6) TaxID=1126212 RepID=K2R9H5_MACPH|nr:hypothetical protein MPH_03658 [Macrophomina phaseolina MS6]
MSKRVAKEKGDDFGCSARWGVPCVSVSTTRLREDPRNEDCDGRALLRSTIGYGPLVCWRGVNGAVVGSLGPRRVARRDAPTVTIKSFLLSCQATRDPVWLVLYDATSPITTATCKNNNIRVHTQSQATDSSMSQALHLPNKTRSSTQRTSLPLIGTVQSSLKYELSTAASNASSNTWLPFQDGVRCPSGASRSHCPGYCLPPYGDFISLLTWTRCCSTCLRKRAPELRVATTATVRRILRLSKELVEKLPSLITLPGVFSMDEKPRKARVKVVDAQSALSAYYKGNSGSGPMLDRISRPDLEFMVCCALPSYNPRTKRIQNGVSCAGCQVAVEDGIDPSGADWLFDFRDMVYSIDGFLKHFEWCEQAQHLWTSSACGTIEPAKYPHSCRSGGYFNRRQ